jgi:hypothetical protein
MGSWCYYCGSDLKAGFLELAGERCSLILMIMQQ